MMALAFAVGDDDLALGQVGPPRASLNHSSAAIDLAQCLACARMGDVVVAVLGQGADRHDSGDGGDEFGGELGPEGLLGVVVQLVDLGREPRVEVLDPLAVPDRQVDARPFDLLIFRRPSA